ncbi:MAG TPA: glycosyltransferase family 4 protein, partial [Steroidobacteraceae bacterium]|nr:glycosyltransferase family 4 protein [Steroidobacteraceae bacterium]
MSVVQGIVPPVAVQVIQPIVPHYRVPFFEGIAKRRELRVRLCVSPTIAGLPPSLPVRGMNVDAAHHYREMLGGRVLWQSGLTLEPSLRRGDVLVIDGNPRLISNIPLFIAARRRGVAIVWWGHGWSATSASLRARFRIRLMRLADIVLLYTDAERDDLIARGFDPARVFALNNAVDEQRIAAAANAWPPHRLAEFTRQNRLEGRKLMLFCGRLRKTPSTDLHVALHALARLAVLSRSYLLAVVGDGPDGRALRDLATRLGVSDHVLWLGSLYDEDELAPWFLSARCFVYPGPVGLSLIQAQAYGLPVITHDNPREHNPEIAALEEGVTGMTVPRGDVRALAECVATICGDDPL